MMRYAIDSNFLQTNVCSNIKIEPAIKDIERDRFNKEHKFLTEKQISDFLRIVRKLITDI